MIDALDDAWFRGKPLPPGLQRRAANWIVERCGAHGGYVEGMAAPTHRDLSRGIQLFTGERIRTGAGTRHILGEESCRALCRLQRAAPEVGSALGRANRSMTRRLGRAEGFYCCGACTVALWRHLAAGGLDHSRRRLAAGMEALHRHRKGGGRWRRFPYWYTMLALLEIDTPAARKEMEYALPACRRILNRTPRAGKHDQRRRLIAQRALHLHTA